MTLHVSGTFKIRNVWPGVQGGAIFDALCVETGRRYNCHASYKVICRIPVQGEFWKITGLKGRLDEKYGQLLQVDSCMLCNMPNEKYIRGLLLNHPNFRGFHLGKAKVNKLLAEIGDFALVEMLNAGRVDHIAEVVSSTIADNLVNAWSKLTNEIALVEFLYKHDFEPALIQKLKRVCKTDAAERLRANPYGLLPLAVPSTSFWNAIERTASKLGFAKDDDNRLVGAAEQIMYLRLKSGHTAITKEDLICECANLLKSKHLGQRAVEEALKCRALCGFYESNTLYLQCVGPAYIESQLEQRLTRLLNQNVQNDIFSILGSGIEQALAQVDNNLNDTQREAVGMAARNKLSVLTGFGGTGKTYVLNEICKLCDRIAKQVFVLAPTGKAKVRAEMSVNRRAFTIHGFIKGLKGNTFDLSGEPLIVVDESSMVDPSLANRLLAALEDQGNYSLLLVGDPGQISPVGWGLFFHELVIEDSVPAAHLNKVYRTGNDLLQNASMKIRSGQNIDLEAWDGQRQGIYLVKCESNQKALCKALVAIQDKLGNMQVITPHVTERMPDNAGSINSCLQYAKLSNEEGQLPSGLRLGKYWLREGDRVIVTENSYDHGLFNGNTGVLSTITVKDSAIYGTFIFDGEEHELSIDDLWALNVQLAYAISIHKSQGSEFNVTVICCITDTPMVERSLMYTAVSRSIDLCLVVGSMDIFNRAIAKLPRSETLTHGFRMNRLEKAQSNSLAQA
ncbi:DNA helicase RecD [Ferrimonas sediminicola]|uniref:DNA helicase RecD n=1 Tax=Ferrimonas sediminicola TaxID=2569538 RepID=A0A4U1B8A7_9GAMM|nr:AAA family ATPase [Ferrimonas sediminicola]TKB46498.1 DNA helicase RecD [Ferrimonas sediminicola]